MGRKKGRNWESDELRQEIISDEIAGATPEQVEQCLKKLETYEHDLFTRSEVSHNRYVPFSDLLPAFQTALHEKFEPATADQLLLDFLRVLFRDHGGCKTTIPGGGRTFWFFLAKSGIKLHESVG